MKLNIDFMLESIWKLLNLICVYTKKRGEKPDFEGGLIIRSATNVEYVVRTPLSLHPRRPLDSFPSIIVPHGAPNDDRSVQIRTCLGTTVDLQLTELSIVLLGLGNVGEVFSAACRSLPCVTE